VKVNVAVWLLTVTPLAVRIGFVVSRINVNVDVQLLFAFSITLSCMVYVPHVLAEINVSSDVHDVKVIVHVPLI
jgi:hypothetical protein